MGKAKQIGFTPEDFIRELRSFIRGANDNATIAVAEIRELLQKVDTPGDVTEEELADAILARVQDHASNNAERGITAAHLWRDMLDNGLSVSLERCGEALEGLEEAGEIKAVPGMVTTYIPVTGEPDETKP